MPSERVKARRPVPLAQSNVVNAPKLPVIERRCNSASRPGESAADRANQLRHLSKFTGYVTYKILRFTGQKDDALMVHVPVAMHP